MIHDNIDDNLMIKLKKLLRGNDINGLYPSREWKECITPLIAAVVKHNTDICSYLLKQGADPNIPSQCGWTRLHYVSLSTAPLVFVEKLLEAKADPNRCHAFTPLLTAATNDREDVVNMLLSAGALVALLPITYPEHPVQNKKLSEMIHKIASKGNEFLQFGSRSRCGGKRSHRVDDQQRAKVQTQSRRMLKPSLLLDF
uniref:Uncharacterized protein n=1 Tax=Neolamprologus brichardi TaxID=32507 RepID=A0A3Q4GNF5_NEOBR